MKPTTLAQQLAPSASGARQCVADHGYAWLAAGMSGFEFTETFQNITNKRPTRRLRNTLT